MAVQRRTLWFTDDDWLTMQAAAAARGVTVSQLIRAIVVDGGAAGQPGGGVSSARPSGSSNRSSTRSRGQDDAKQAGRSPTVVAPAERPAGGHGFGRSRPAPKPGR